MNLIDGGNHFLAAEAATMKRVFPHVALFEMASEPHNHMLAGSYTLLLDIPAMKLGRGVAGCHWRCPPATDR